MTSDRNFTQSIHMPISAVGAQDFTLLPYALLVGAQDAFLGAGVIHELHFEPALPASSRVQILDHVEDTSAPGKVARGGSGTPDPDLGFGQFDLSGLYCYDLDPDSGGGTITTVKTNGVHVMTPNTTVLTPTTKHEIPDNRIKADMKGETKDWYGRVECRGGIVIGVYAGAAYDGAVTIEMSIGATGAEHYRRWQRRTSAQRTFSVGSYTGGAVLDVEVASTEQYVPIGKPYDAVIAGTGLTGDNGVPLDGHWKNLEALALSGGNFIVRVPMPLAAPGAAAGTVEILWPRAYQASGVRT